MMPKLMGFILNYLLLLLIAGGFILVDLGMNIVDDLVMEKIDEEEQLRETQKKRLTDFRKSMKGEKMSMYQHRGFDFDGAAGHDILVTDTILNRLH